jgi:hypothetical protein
LIEDASRLGEAMGLPVWCTDQAGPYPTVPYPGRSWRPEGRPARQPHEYLRAGTAKALTLFRPADGHVRLKAVTSWPNSVLHPWLRGELAAILTAMPDPPAEPVAGWRAAWGRWQEGLTIKPTLLDEPPLRMLLVLDNLAGHKAPELVLWLFEHGVMPLYTPVGGSWLNMTESIQRILKLRAWMANTRPAPIRSSPGWRLWRGTGMRPRRRSNGGGKRASRRRRQWERRHRLGGSGACARTPLRLRPRPGYGRAQAN